jgi:hypothetical protein
MNYKLRNEIGSLPAIEGGCVTDDNIGIALAMYFEALPQCPQNDRNDETGWSQWAMDMANNALDRIVDHFSNKSLEWSGRSHRLKPKPSAAHSA